MTQPMPASFWNLKNLTTITLFLTFLGGVLYFQHLAHVIAAETAKVRVAQDSLVVAQVNARSQDSLYEADSLALVIERQMAEAARAEAARVLVAARAAQRRADSLAASAPLVVSDSAAIQWHLAYNARTDEAIALRSSVDSLTRANEGQASAQVTLQADFDRQRHAMARLRAGSDSVIVGQRILIQKLSSTRPTIGGVLGWVVAGTVVAYELIKH